MKHLKILGFAALAAMAVMALVGVGTASATELYKYTTPSANDTLGVGTVLKGTLTGGTATLERASNNEFLDTCTGSELEAEVTNAGGASATVLGPLTKLSWSGCAEPTSTATLGSLEIHHIAGTTNGTLTAKNTVVDVNTTIFGAICHYTAGEALDLGTLTGATSSTGNATITINVVVKATNGFICPEARWTASYAVTSPTGLIVEAS